MKPGSSGLPVWLVQRVAAVYMLLFLPFIVWSLTVRPMHSHSEWRDWVTNPAMTVALCFFFLALLSHMWVGLRDVLLDYAKPPVVARVSVMLLGFALLLLGGWVLGILVKARL